MARRKGFSREFWRKLKDKLAAASKDGQISSEEHKAIALDHVQFNANAHQIFRQTANNVLNIVRADLVKTGEFVLVGDGKLKHRNDLSDADIVIVTSRKEKATLGSLCSHVRWLYGTNQLDACVRHLRLIAEVWPMEAQEVAAELDIRL